MTDWCAKADALVAGWKLATEGSPPPTRTAVLLTLAQAMGETHAGDDWPGSHNWGAVQYRKTNILEQAAMATGSLDAGMWLLPDGSTTATHDPAAVAQLHVDTHPGGVKYAVWFAAFPDDAHGACHFLRTVILDLGGELLDPALPSGLYAECLYRAGYYEGAHPGARPLGARTGMLTAPELANVADYTRLIDRCRATLETALADWTGVVDVASDPGETAAGSAPTDPAPAA